MKTNSQTLTNNVHPPDWVNPEPAPRYNMVVIGAGPAGLIAAAGAAGLGARVALVEKSLMGGDCLNTGCVPSKAIIRSSRAAHDVHSASEFGILSSTNPEVDFQVVTDRMKSLQAQISRHDSVHRFHELGVDVFLGEAQFSGPNAVRVDDKMLYFKKALIATGGKPVHPPIEGLQKAGFLTNETVFTLTKIPRRLAVVGGGPVGCELAQAFCRFGSQVTIIEVASQLLAREDLESASIIAKMLQKENIDVRLETKLKKVTSVQRKKLLCLESAGKETNLEVDEILVGVGRAPNMQSLCLEKAGVAHASGGIVVNPYLQTSNPKVYAAGDICMDWKFTHAAEAAAKIVIQNALFLGRKKLSTLIIPRCTYTNPEVAHVGMCEREAKEKGIKTDVFVKPLEEVDRGLIDAEVGFVKVLVKKGTDQILGATIVASHAGEMISEITLAMVAGVGLKKLSSVVHPYPTQAEAIKQVGGLYNRTRLTPLVKKLLSTWLAWTR
ncbi:MAG: mercuric reductase [Acidobacteriota bacterium]|nr:mercuric reductase [Acidobacteriota bacterium]